MLTIGIALVLSFPLPATAAKQKKDDKGKPLGEKIVTEALAPDCDGDTNGKAAGYVRAFSLGEHTFRLGTLAQSGFKRDRAHIETKIDKEDSAPEYKIAGNCVILRENNEIGTIMDITPGKYVEIKFQTPKSRRPVIHSQSPNQARLPTPKPSSHEGVKARARPVVYQPQVASRLVDVVAIPPVLIAEPTHGHERRQKSQNHEERAGIPRSDARKDSMKRREWSGNPVLPHHLAKGAEFEAFGQPAEQQ
jgi:hypothetical protein